MGEACRCIKRPAREGDPGWPDKKYIVKVSSNCQPHFQMYSARTRVNIMIRELTEGE